MFEEEKKYWNHRSVTEKRDNNKRDKKRREKIRRDKRRDEKDDI